MLTISIPTYNRPKQLLDCVGRLLPQLDDDCELRIYDNCSTTPMGEVLADLLKQFPKAKTKVIRNQANVGMLGNIIHCMEDCPSPWLTICSDDDIPDADYVVKAKQAIVKYPQSVFISFALGDEKRSSTFMTNGLSEFARANFNFGTPLAISADAFHMAALKPFMSTAYMYAYSLAPHVAIVIAALRVKGGQCAFVSERLADCGRDTSLESWSRIWYPSLSLLLELIPNETDRKAFGEKLIPYMISQNYLVNMFIANSIKTGADNSFLFNSRMKLRSLIISSLPIRIKQIIFRQLINNPTLGLKVMAFLNRNKKQVASFDSSKENFFGRV